MSLDLARRAADAVLYEGYLLYPYRSTAQKNQIRWQFGVLGPPTAAQQGLGEESDLSVQTLLRLGPEAQVTVHLRCLQLQRRTVEREEADGTFAPVDELFVGGRAWTSWDEATEVERHLGPWSTGQLTSGVAELVTVDGGEDVEALSGARLVRRRWPLRAHVHARLVHDEAVWRLELSVVNAGAPAADKDEAIRSSLIGAHLLLETQGGQFLSVIDPVPDALAAARRCKQHRCWPVLAGEPATDLASAGVVLASPIILYDFPAIADESSVAMFDSTEIDEILTLRVLTLTDEEKAAARSTDPAAAAIIDRCEQMTPFQLQQLHGVLRDPHAAALNLRTPADGDLFATDAPWWDPAEDASVDPETDVVVINGMSVARGSVVVVRPSRRADAQDMFFAGQEARVTSVHLDVDGSTHVGVVLTNDPAADLHEWYGRSLYFAPDELEPVGTSTPGEQEREQSW